MKNSSHLVLAQLPQEQIAVYLREIGDSANADVFANAGQAGGQSLTVPFRQYRWMAANHLIGFVAAGGASGKLAITSAVSISPDMDLIGTAIKVTLNKFHVDDYPGRPNHKVLLEFAARHQAAKRKEDIRFSTTCEIGDKDSTKAGAPIFVDVLVPANGLALEGRTVNIQSKGDEELIGVLKSKAFKHGLTLLAHAQPALPLLAQMSAGVVEQLLKRSRNRAVQDFELGLDFSNSGTSPQLRLGSYVVVQFPDDGSWKWSDWFYDQSAMAVVHAQTGKPLEANYLILGISGSSMAGTGAGGAGKATEEDKPSKSKKGDLKKK